MDTNSKSCVAKPEERSSKKGSGNGKTRLTATQPFVADGTDHQIAPLQEKKEKGTFVSSVYPVSRGQTILHSRRLSITDYKRLTACAYNL